VSEVPIRRSEAHFDGVAGRRLFERRWEPETPQRSLVIVHGYAEHSGRYEHVGAWFAARGAAVHAFDHQGHGHSSGVRCHVRRFGDFLDDLDRVVERARALAPDVPLYVVGHSMGGLMVCNWAVERTPEVDGLVISAPALGTDQAPSGLRMAALRVLRRVWPTGFAGGGLDAEALSRDPEVVKAYLEDPLIVLRMTFSLGTELFDALARTAGRGGEVRVPLLMLHGTDDALCSPAASEAFARAAPHARYVSYPDLRHEIFNEPEQEQVFADVQRFLLELEGAGAPRAGSAAESADAS
jgi:alpha-beta hydrolase superfamily lysophospholipase